MKIAIVIPGYNEARRISDVIADVSQLPKLLKGHEFEIIVVDDGSRDSTAKKAREHRGDMPKRTRLNVLRHGTNLGKGAAVQTGCEAARRLKADITVLMDGDGQHRAADVSTLVGALTKEMEPTLVIGARTRNRTMPFMMRFGNGLLSSLARGFFNIRVRDSQSGLRAFATSTYPLIRWSSSHYAMETEMLIMASASHVKLIEVPIETIYHDHHKGTTPLDGLRIVRTLFEWRFFRSPLRYLSVNEFDESLTKPRRMITGIQVLAIFAALVLSYFSFLHYKRKEFTIREYLGWQLVWVCFGSVTLFPEWFRIIAGRFGAISTLDFFTVVGFIVVLSISFYTYVNVDRLRKRLEKAIQELALKGLDDSE